MNNQNVLDYSENKVLCNTNCNEITIEKVPIIDINILNPYYTFRIENSNSSIDNNDYTRIYNYLVFALQKCIQNGMIIDIDLIPEKAKINCQYYSNSGAVYIPFIVSLFRIKNSEDIVFEFQKRREGSIFNIYHACLYELHNINVIKSPNSVKLKDHRISPYTPYIQYNETMREFLERLIEMSNTKFIDVKLQALESIIELVSEESYRVPIINLDFISELIKFLSLDEDIQRLSLGILKFLTKTPKGRDVFLNKNCIDLIRTIKKETKNLQIKREIDSILRNIANP
jgi:hypothetical protein